MNAFKLIAESLGRYRRSLVAAAACVLFEGSLELCIPFLMSTIIDEGIAAGDLGIVWTRGAAMVACALAALSLGMGYARLSARAAMGVGANLRRREFEHVQRLSFANLDDLGPSSLVTRLTTDITVIQNALVAGFRPLMRGAVMFTMGIVFSSCLSPALALSFYVVAPVLALALVLIVRHVGPLYRKLQSTMDRLNDALEEDLVGVRAVKAFVREDHVAARFDRVNTDLASMATRTFASATLNTPVFQAAMYTTCVLALWRGGSMILAGELTAGVLTGFMSYILQVINSLMMISNVFLLMARADASAERIEDVLGTKPTIEDPQHAVTKVADGSVEFDHVSFKYRASAEKYVLEDVSLRIPAGATVGVLGATGSGKSTLVSLVARLYDVSEGSVRVGGHDVRSYDVEALRDAVGVVLQKNVLFSGTVRENLQWGAPEATDEELLEACRLAAADEFLGRIGGLDGDLGQGGVNVSGGQKQRLCIARALLKKPQVLILDDSTSAVDMATDARIRASLAGLAGTTKIVIAQRVASVANADLIAILDDGRVHAVGTPADLLSNDPIYQELYYSQNAGSKEVSGDGR